MCFADSVCCRALQSDLNLNFVRDTMCVCVGFCVLVCMRVYACVCMCMRVSACVCMCACVCVRARVQVYAGVCECEGVYVSVCVCACLQKKTFRTLQITCFQVRGGYD